MTGKIVRIQRFSTTNGPGLRSTVFVKGCPLTCHWCHNPEMQESKKQLMVYPEQCKACGICVKTCEHGGHSFVDGKHIVDRTNCVLCGKCEQMCPHSAIELAGQDVEASEVLERLLRDRPFYDSSKGGITISGGEPLAQFNFTKELLQLCKAEGLHTCLDTSGWGGRAAELVQWVDLYLWDFKESDPERHKYYTGVELEPILDSLQKMNDAGGKCLLRCPIIPGVNDRDAHLEAIAELANRMPCIQVIDLVPYHRLGVAKADAIGMHQDEFSSLTQEEKDHFLSVVTAKTNTQARWI